MPASSSGGKPPSVARRLRPALAFLLAIVTGLAATGAGTEIGEPQAAVPPDPGEREIKALAAAWPARISSAEKRDGDWALLLDGTWFSWAQGRLLPETERERWQEFTSYRFYRYPLTLPPLPVFGEEEAARLKQAAKEQAALPPRRETFLEQLLGASSAGETWKRIVRVDFAGHTAKVHDVAAGPLAEVATEVRVLAAADDEVAAFLGNLSSVEGYSWRSVSGTRSRSYHAYGLAVDLIPVRYRGHPYWQWAAERVERWWEIPYEKRWMIPAAVVEAFERHGFVWGGKWLYFDTMHFEYRPEVLLLARQGE